MSSESIPYQTAAEVAMCSTCPVAQIADPYWRENIHEGIVYDAANLVRALRIFRTDAQTNNDPARLLQSVHDDLLALYTEEYGIPNFANLENGEIRMDYPAVEGQGAFVAEADLPGPAGLFARCIRHIQRGECAPEPSVEELPAYLWANKAMAVNALENVARYGDAATLRRIMDEVLDALDVEGEHDRTRARRSWYYARGGGEEVDRIALMRISRSLRKDLLADDES